MIAYCPPPPRPADVATMSYAQDERSPSGQGPALKRQFPTAYLQSKNAGTLNTVDSLFARIDSLTQLQNDWDTYGAVAPNTLAAQWAKSTTQLADRLDLVPTAIVPSPENGIGIAFRNGRRYGDIEIFNSGEILAVVSDGTGKPKVWEVDRSADGISEALKEIRDYLW